MADDGNSSLSAPLLSDKETMERFDSNSGDRRGLEQQQPQARFGNPSATFEVKIGRKNKWSSDARARFVVQAELHPNPEVLRRVRESQVAAAHGRPLPKRGDVKKKIWKDFVDCTSGFCCSSPTSTLEVDEFLNVLPIPTKSQAMATIWPDISA